MMADMKERRSVASVVTLAVTEIVKLREVVMEREMGFRKDKLLSRCLGKMEEQRTLKDVEQRLSTLVDETLVPGGERNKGNLRQLGTHLLKLKMHMDKQIMSLMMQPEENGKGVCDLVEQYSEDLAEQRICFDMDRVNEVGFEGEAACFSTLVFSNNLNQLLEKTEIENEQVLGDLAKNMGEKNRNSDIIQHLEQLEAIYQKLEQLLKIQGLLSLQVYIRK